jgi:hypothetical protein
MKNEEHKNRHIELHKAFDELFADFIRCHPEETQFTNKPILELMNWSYQQTITPTEMIEES